jgi:hypothetical protein
MSSTLYWEPVKPKKGKSLDTGLKWILQKRYGSPVQVELDDGDIPYLQGLADANTEGAQTLIDAIEKYGRIELREEF